ncbi:MAG: NUDIX domain-containing protein, partial [Armatimonadetes bacterium]|nr:NUDIX domain-containing protein [Armatimonadota bacterium]
MEKTLSSKLIYSGELINLLKEKVKLKNGKTAFREIVCHPGSVVGMILTLNKKIILIKQYRKAVKKFLWELPAGRIEKGENLREAA